MITAVIVIFSWLAAFLVIAAIVIGEEGKRIDAICATVDEPDEDELPYAPVDHGVLVDMEHLDEWRGVWAMENGAPE